MPNADADKTTRTTAAHNWESTHTGVSEKRNGQDEKDTARFSRNSSVCMYLAGMGGVMSRGHISRNRSCRPSLYVNILGI